MQIKEIPFNIAKEFLTKHHYLHSIPKGTSYCFGAFKSSELEGVICFSNPIAKNLWKGLFNVEVSIIELSRLAIKEESEIIASQLISKAIKLVDYDAIISYADTSQGHIGIVYQATNWLYLGTSQKRTEYYLKSKPELHSRTLFGNKTVEELREIHGEDLDKRETPYKLKYLYLKTKKAKKSLKATTESYAKSIDEVLRKYIYCWENKLNGKKYVGKTSRPISHRYTAFNPVNGSNGTYFVRAINKYGKENFQCSIVEELEGSITPEKLRERELYWINELNTLRPYGYNVSIPTSENGGSDTRPDSKGIPRTEYVREKMSLNWETGTRKLIRGKLVSPEGKLVEIENLSRFLNGTEELSSKDERTITAVLRGKRNYAKGWRKYNSDIDLIPFSEWERPKVVYSDETKQKKLDSLKKRVGYEKQLISPEGKLIKFFNYSEVKDLIGSSPDSICSFYRDPKRKIFKQGWKKVDV